MTSYIYLVVDSIDGNVKNGEETKSLEAVLNELGERGYRVDQFDKIFWQTECMSCETTILEKELSK